MSTSGNVQAQASLTRDVDAGPRMVDLVIYIDGCGVSKNSSQGSAGEVSVLGGWRIWFAGLYLVVRSIMYLCPFA
jgi:hypothetical protein